MRFYSHLSDDERDQIAILRAAGRSMGPLPGRSVERKPRSPGSSSGTHSPRAGIPRFTPPREAILEREAALRLFVGDRLAEG